MKYGKCLLVSLVVLIPFSLTAFAEESAPEVKQEVKSAMTPTAGAAQHEHALGKVNRVVAAVDPDGFQRVEVLGGDYYFDPNYIVVKVNTPVELTVRKASGYITHDMVVKAPDAGIDFKVDLDSKKPETVEFTPTKIGKYEMLCDKKLLFFKSHKDKGMNGMIEVVE